MHHTSIWRMILHLLRMKNFQLEHIFTVCCCQRALKAFWRFLSTKKMYHYFGKFGKILHIFQIPNQVKDDIVKGHLCGLNSFLWDIFVVDYHITLTILLKIHFLHYYKTWQWAYSWIPFTCFELYNQDITCKTTTECNTESMILAVLITILNSFSTNIPSMQPIKLTPSFHKKGSTKIYH